MLVSINEGQTLDVQRFQNPAHVVALETADDLDRYTYLVAGCVGEFWTRVCWRKLPRFTSETREMMLEWGVGLWRGLATREHPARRGRGSADGALLFAGG